MKNNKLIVAAAGSGKTSLLVEEALKIKDENVLITTFTESNRDEINKKILEKKKYLPKNITVQTWFSFLLQHGVRPYQSLLNVSLHDLRVGFHLFQGKSAPYISESDVFRYFFSKDLKIYSDKIANFVYKTNEKSQNEVINRICRIYPNIFVDEVQDLAGWDLDILKLFLESSSKVLMVGDPRQAVYDTNDSPKYKKYRGSGILDFVNEKCGEELCPIDPDTLIRSHRNNSLICNLSSKLYPNLPETLPCECPECSVETDHDGVFLIRQKDVVNYLKMHKSTPVQLRLRSDSKGVEHSFAALNFGLSKGLSFDRVLIFPTVDMKKWLLNRDAVLADKTRAQFYVAMTRARYSVAIVSDYKDSASIEGVQNYVPC